MARWSAAGQQRAENSYEIFGVAGVDVCIHLRNAGFVRADQGNNRRVRIHRPETRDQVFLVFLRDAVAHDEEVEPWLVTRIAGLVKSHGRDHFVPFAFQHPAAGAEQGFVVGRGQNSSHIPMDAAKGRWSNDFLL